MKWLLMWESQTSVNLFKDFRDITLTEILLNSDSNFSSIVTERNTVKVKNES